MNEEKDELLDKMPEKVISYFYETEILKDADELKECNQRLNELESFQMYKEIKNSEVHKKIESQDPALVKAYMEDLKNNKSTTRKNNKRGKKGMQKK
ncbi:hypothetical protein CWI36_0049p0050 [Hamiltosporidium magnivora]|uniref:Uncharacterized protein n=1 Tax=Hamiltosporidium magnivora TaxID=148818 RepID=A0A4Q9LNX7_9MICR|nr:hypothetical protein CWI36_0049p0050 [Hamiltosporidium magnivora]